MSELVALVLNIVVYLIEMIAFLSKLVALFPLITSKFLFYYIGIVRKIGPFSKTDFSCFRGWSLFI